MKVELQVTVNVAPPEGSRLPAHKLQQAAVQAVWRAVRAVEATGFAHDLQEVSIETLDIEEIDRSRTADMPLRQVIEDVCENLPEDWEIEIQLRCGEASIDLYHPDGDRVEVCDDDLNTVEMLQRRVDHARVADGLAPHFDSDYTTD